MSESTITLWNCAGEEEEVDPMPESFQRWVATDGGEPPEDENWRSILHAVEATLSRKIVQVDSLSELGFNLVLDVKYENGEQEIVRSPQPETDGDVQTWGSAIDRFWREVHLLKWLKVHSTLPVPTVRHIIDAHEPELVRPISIMDKMPGAVAMNVMGRLPYPAKVCTSPPLPAPASHCVFLPLYQERLVHAYAEQMIAPFRLDVPQRIGTPKCSADGTSMEVIPRYTVRARNTATQIYDTLEDWLASLVANRARANGIGTDAAARLRGQGVLARLATELTAICARLAQPAHRRCVLVHDDLSHFNVLVDTEGSLTAIVDWEFASVLPAVVAVDYPDFLRDDGLWSPKYGQEGASFWMASPQDAATLREFYREVAKSKDLEYWEALVEGETLRNAVDWLTKIGNDEGCALLEELMDTIFVHD
ncbi:hypothetical protein TRAPUB_5042 [Trametes pubescens]|uniref:Aminoglycoside phosphotransferase domain-containing protein n=1 Tax=Trametes pubescens TaxID=154538 RepID=A0A1M2V9N8_TRAPU|nr:hypothetical protein TRAPUB_5042 [Trametes pubescens]